MSTSSSSSSKNKKLEPNQHLTNLPSQSHQVQSTFPFPSLHPQQYPHQQYPQQQQLHQQHQQSTAHLLVPSQPHPRLFTKSNPNPSRLHPPTHSQSDARRLAHAPSYPASDSGEESDDPLGFDDQVKGGKGYEPVRKRIRSGNGIGNVNGIGNGNGGNGFSNGISNENGLLGGVGIGLGYDGDRSGAGRTRTSSRIGNGYGVGTGLSNDHGFVGGFGAGGDVGGIGNISGGNGTGNGVDNHDRCVGGVGLGVGVGGSRRCGNGNENSNGNTMPKNGGGFGDTNSSAAGFGRVRGSTGRFNSDPLAMFRPRIGPDGIMRNLDGRPLVGHGSKNMHACATRPYKKREKVLAAFVSSTQPTTTSSTIPSTSSAGNKYRYSSLDAGIPGHTFFKLFSILHKRIINNISCEVIRSYIGDSPSPIETTLFKTFQLNLKQMMGIMIEMVKEMESKGSWTPENLMESGERRDWLKVTDDLLNNWHWLREAVNLPGTMMQDEDVAVELSKLNIDPERKILSFWRSIDRLHMSWIRWILSEPLQLVDGEWKHGWGVGYCEVDMAVMNAIVWINRVVSGEEMRVRVILPTEVGENGTERRGMRLIPWDKDHWNEGFEEEEREDKRAQGHR